MRTDEEHHLIGGCLTPLLQEAYNVISIDCRRGLHSTRHLPRPGERTDLRCAGELCPWGTSVNHVRCSEDILSWGSGHTSREESAIIEGLDLAVSSNVQSSSGGGCS